MAELQQNTEGVFHGAGARALCPAWFVFMNYHYELGGSSASPAVSDLQGRARLIKNGSGCQ